MTYALLDHSLRLSLKMEKAMCPHSYNHPGDLVKGPGPVESFKSYCLLTFSIIFIHFQVN